MPSPTVLFILAEGFEEIEAVTPIDILRRAGAEVTVAALGDGIHVAGRSGLTVHADTTLAAAEGSRFDCLVLPGGPGVARLRADPRVAGLVRRQCEGDGWIGAICAAPVVLKDAGVLDGRRHTAHFSVAGELPGALLGERVVADGRMVTSRGAGTAVDFALVLVEKLFGPASSADVARSICT
ncbi:MAG TPA: DJ-1 family glyoxalase III [Opitutaceae bacterium]|nr:DJ-1 family glyoxalase III [Opitutaceae bacterium]